ncbi:hypothetical protein [uncultured Tessaracoccus sp.]|uniref:hypothetical protein n=1 Tax=uncultured Tessaracoccus sp. TaxID=905023 RepID=UPI0026256F1A|nr:hypothetical protein [uncultured Tessaracoccus sp.]
MSGTTTKGTISTVRFALIIVAIIGLGLAGVLVVTTSIGAQANELTKLQREANKLEYESASLRTQLEGLSSTSSLAMRASELNMVPNPYPAFVMLGSGQVLGEPTKVSGDEFPELRRHKPQRTPKSSPHPVVTPSPVPPIPKPEQSGEHPEDVVAAQQPAGSPAPSAAPTPQPTNTPGGER